MSASPIEIPAKRPRVVPILIASFIGFLAGQIVALLLNTLGVAITHYPGGMSALATASDPPSWSNALSLAGLWVGFAAAIYYAYREGHLSALPHQWRPRWSDLVYVVVGVACQVVIDLSYAPFHFKSLNHPVNHLFKAANGPGFLLIAVLTTVVAPFFEEWLFRGVIFRAVSEGLVGVTRRWAVTSGVIVSAGLFGLAHAEALQFAGLAAFGVVLALVVHRTKRLVPSFIAHASFNAVALAAVIAQRAGH